MDIVSDRRPSSSLGCEKLSVRPWELRLACPRDSTIGLMVKLSRPTRIWKRCYDVRPRPRNLPRAGMCPAWRMPSAVSPAQQQGYLIWSLARLLAPFSLCPESGFRCPFCAGSHWRTQETSHCSANRHRNSTTKLPTWSVSVIVYNEYSALLL